MALVEPLIGHLLSKYKETVLEGLSKIRNAVQSDDAQGAALATALTQQEEALQTIRATLLKPEYFVATVQTLTVVLTHLAERGSRVAFLREVLRGDCAALFRKTLGTLSDSSLPHVIAAFQFLTPAVKDAPLVVLARLRSTSASASSSGAGGGAGAGAAAAPSRADVPLHLAAFRLQLTYGQRRVRLARLGFLVQLITSPMHNAVAETVCSHGVLTHLLEDAAELLREGTNAGITCSMDALQVVRERFVQSHNLTPETKRGVLLAQRNIFRLLVRALEFDPVADHAAAILYAVVEETIESPADYASTRVESLEDHGMPNYLLFFLLRQLRPKASERMATLVLHILQRAPDLIRPYFTRLSGHLAEEGSTHGIAPTTARVAVVNVMTRAFLCPMPYHLAAGQARLEPVAAKASTFYTMCPRDVADEICPVWVSEYVHSLINGSTNLLLLTLAMQLTQAALMRAKRVLALVQAAQRAAERRKTEAMSSGVRKSGDANTSLTFSAADLAALQGGDVAESEMWDAFDSQVRHHLQTAIPSREEFWHRMTQQLHRSLTSAPTAPANDASLAKVHVVTQRMLLLMKNYVDVFDVRVPWLSAVPTFLPDLRRVVGRDGQTEKNAFAGLHPITAALQQHNDILCPWPALSVALLCQLLVASHQRRVPMVKLHHVNMSQAQGVGEWPLLLSVLLWVAHHLHDADAAMAVGWAAQLLLWTVHSVTIHSTCTLAEAHLWLEALTPNTVPLFLHVLNHLLMRSLSKAADRVTQELREARCGVLVAAADHFMDRTKEKQLRRSEAAADVAPTTATAAAAAVARRVKGVKPPATKSGAEGAEAVPGTNLWGTHLQTALPEFAAVVQRVRQGWADRESALRQANSALHHAATTASMPRVTQQQCIDVLVLASRQCGVVSTKGRAVLSVVQQLRSFALTLHSPVLPMPEDEAGMAALAHLHNTTASGGKGDEEDSHLRTIAAALGIAVTPKAKAAAGASAAVALWYTKPCICWHIAGRLLASTDTANEKGGGETAPLVAVGLLRAVLAQRAAVEAVLVASGAREGSAVGLLVLLFACVRVLLSSPTTATAALSPEESDALGAVCLINYTGGLSVQDRLCYAVCLALHYLVEGPPLATDRENEECTTVHPDSARRPSAHHHHTSTSSSTTTAEHQPQHFLHHGATAPRALVQRRFLVAGHTGSAIRTGEVEMLAWHLDTLTEADMRHSALRVSSRLHNCLLPRHNASVAHTAAEDLLCAAYPELDNAADVAVVNVEQLASAEVLDLRYMLPLLHRVAALPTAHLEHLPTGRAIPLLLRGLTMVDAGLRAAAAAALAALYIPKGALRIVVGVARLKLCQLLPRGSPNSDVVLPRLPGHLAVFLITAIDPLSRYEDPLHHHLIHFLLHIDAALATPVPFVKWTHTPPLTAISVPLMMEKQEALQQRTHKLGYSNGSTGGCGDITQASVADVSQELRKSAPPQLPFILSILRHACDVQGDAIAVLDSGSLDGLMLICDLLSASNAHRGSYVSLLLDLCTRSAAVTRLFALRGNALVWTVGFLGELCREYGAGSPYPYSGPSFTVALQLLRVLCAGVLGGTTTASAPPAVLLSVASVEQLQENLQQLRASVAAAQVTARDVLDALDDVAALCAGVVRSNPSAPAEVTAAKKKEAVEEETAAVAVVSAAQGKREREKVPPAELELKASLKRVKAETAV